MLRKRRIELCDAHVHFDVRKQDAGKDLVKYLEENKLKKMVIIVNNRAQMDILHTHAKELSPYLNRIEFVFAINKNDEFWIEGLNYCKENHKYFNLKVHPRLFSISQNEIEWYVNFIGQVNPHLTVVDDFLYGDDVQEDIGLKLICEIAKKYPEKPVIMAHAGGADLLRHVMKTKIYKNVYYDISLTGNYFSESSIEQDIAWLLKFMANRVLLGSDYPDFSINDALTAINKQAKKVRLTKEKLIQISYRNIEDLYGGDSFESTDKEGNY